MQLDVLKGKLMQVQQAKQTESVKTYLSVLKELIDGEVIASFNLRGEEASCALAKIQGMTVALNLEELFNGTLAAHTKSQIIHPR